MEKVFKIGIDIGSTTLKCVVLDESDNAVYTHYMRHYSKIDENLFVLLGMIKDNVDLKGAKTLISFSGSAGMGISDSCKFPFYQEVYANLVVKMQKFSL